LMLPCTKAMLARWLELMKQEPYLSAPTYSMASDAAELHVRHEFGCDALWFWEV
jgi:hypothetical protein